MSAVRPKDIEEKDKDYSSCGLNMVEEGDVEEHEGDDAVKPITRKDHKLPSQTSLRTLCNKSRSLQSLVQPLH